ncbi:unnamed protein product [Parnassius mnemosyne]|uniref:Lipase domain-containing protein n=1 Tax=Parnassius mnemosyne TaxID=213953 RepID=A0AAV1M231_9NEOP
MDSERRWRPHLVDLEEPVDEPLLRNRNGANNHYWLFTRSNHTNRQVIVHGNANTIRNSNYIRNRPIFVTVHGWNNNGNSEMNPLLTSGFLAVQDANINVVDWSGLANSNYNTAANGVPNVGQHLGNSLIWLINTAGGNWNNVHLVGFSLGSHVVGNAGRTAGGRPARVTVCAGSAIPLVPGDNSHYVEGESRYVWIPDGDGVPHLVDLEEPVDEELLRNRNGAKNQYWLFTRSNPTNRQVIVHGNANTIRNSNYNKNRPIFVTVHGWSNDGTHWMNPLLTSAFLAVQDANVIVVDWGEVAKTNYNTAANGVPNVGQHLGNFLVWLINTAGGNWNNVHLVGFSLGAHVVGNAGRTAGGRPARVTGLDPAGPRWAGNSNALNRNAGQYVESIHTDGRILGIMNAISDADFYPNGGRNPQPGCRTSSCSHDRAPELFASSVRTNHFVGRLCPNINEAELSTCNGAAFNMGNAVMNKRGRGIYALRTGSSWPF